MVQKFEFQEVDLKGAYLIKPFLATDDRGGLLKDYNVEVDVILCQIYLHMVGQSIASSSGIVNRVQKE